MKFSWRLLVATLFVLPLVLSSAGLSLAITNFNDPAFGKTWARVDRPVDFVTPARLGRGYTWGGFAPGSESVTTEIYNGQPRKVQYFDKARMEINNPNGNSSDLFYVTTGLLVKELVMGVRQDGDGSFTPLEAATIQVAGDSNENGANAIAPTYASFRPVVTFFLEENQAPARPGGLINQSLDKNGIVSTIVPPEQLRLQDYDSITHHNIADVFVQYSKQRGLIWVGQDYKDPLWREQDYKEGSLFFDNPLYVLGRPIAEPYWVRAVVAGQERDVLVQLFERRVLTYTPSNPDPYKVEMGNVGQHYYRWRYGLIKNPVPLSNTSATNLTSSGNYLFWTNFDTNKPLVTGYDLTTGKTFLTINPSQLPTNLVSNGKILAWLQQDKGLVLYDLASGKQTTVTGCFDNLALFEDQLYHFCGNSQAPNGKGTYIRNLTTGQEKFFGPMSFTGAVLADGVAVWSEANFGPKGSLPDIQIHFLKLDGSQGNTTLVKGSDFLSGYSVSEDNIVWSLSIPTGINGVNLYNITSKTTRQIIPGPASHPLIRGSWVVWTVPFTEGASSGWSIKAYRLDTGQVKTLVATNRAQELQGLLITDQNQLLYSVADSNGQNQLYKLDL